MIRVGNSSDIEKIALIYEDAKKLFSDLGYFQWKGEYPNINNAINVNHVMAEDDEFKQEDAQKVRRTELPKTSNEKVRRTATPDYKVVSTK